MAGRKLTEEEKEARRKWRKMPWTTKSFVMTPDGGRRPYDKDRDALDHIARPLYKYLYGDSVKVDWTPEHKAKLAEMDRQAALENKVT